MLTKAKRGTQVYYVTGNHDEFLRKFVGFGLAIGNIRIVNEHVHTTPTDAACWSRTATRST